MDLFLRLETFSNGCLSLACLSLTDSIAPILTGIISQKTDSRFKKLTGGIIDISQTRNDPGKPSDRISQDVEKLKSAENPVSV
jgi:hypothetical protein